MHNARRAFTLIELMIVVALIAIISSISIPSLLRSRIAANEASAASAMKTIVSVQASFRQTDGDGNGTFDYWTENLEGMRTCVAAGGGEIKLIDMAMTRADEEFSGTTAAKSGYLFRALDADANGSSYTTGSVRTYRYAFRSRPVLYSTSGIRTFIVDQDGVVYSKDLGLATTNLLSWISSDPSTSGWLAIGN